MARIGNRGEMEAFVRSVELGGFSAAARELGLTPSALSKLVTRLERTLRVRLLSRTTRRLAPTAEGELFLARCRRILSEIEDAEHEVGRSRAKPRGRLRLHVGVGFGRHQLVPALPRFLERYPEVQVELIVEDRSVDLVREAIDISVRPWPPKDDAVVVRKVCDFERLICASPKYLARHGSPRSPADLGRHNCITLSGATVAAGKWLFDTPAGRRTIDVAGSIKANNVDCVLQLALMGLGIARFNDFIVAQELGSGTLVPVLTEFHCADPTAMNAIYPHERDRLPRVAAMLQFLNETFRDRPWRRKREALADDPGTPRRPRPGH